MIGGYLHAKLLDYPPFAGKPPPKQRKARPRTYRKQVTGDSLDGVDLFVGAGLVAFVWNFDEEEPGAGEGGVALQSLALEPVDGVKSPLVVELGG